MFASLIIVVLAIGLSVGCNSDARPIGPNVFEVFRGFELVAQGEAKFDADGSIDVTHVALHDGIADPLPQTVSPRVQYIFHYPGGRPNNERLGADQMPERLRKLGFTVLTAPGYNGGQFSYPYIGGPLFSITFADGKHRGVIFNRVEGQLEGKNWIVEDYILILLS